MSSVEVVKEKQCPQSSFGDFVLFCLLSVQLSRYYQLEEDTHALTKIAETVGNVLIDVSHALTEVFVGMERK